MRKESGDRCKHDDGLPMRQRCWVLLSYMERKALRSPSAAHTGVLESNPAFHRLDDNLAYENERDFGDITTSGSVHAVLGSSTTRLVARMTQPLTTLVVGVTFSKRSRIRTICERPDIDEIQEQQS